MSPVVIFGLMFSILLIILGLLLPKSKSVTFIIIAWIIILTSFNNGGADWNVHLNIFKDSYFSLSAISNGFFNSGLFILLYGLFKSIGFSFYSTNFIINFICIMLLYKIISKKTKNVNIVLVFLIIYPLVEIIIQKRNFVSSIFVLLGFCELFNNEKKYSKLLGFFYLLVASLLHQATFIYFLFAVFFLLNDKVIDKILMVIIPLSFLITPFLPKILGIFFSSSKIQLYFYQLKVSNLSFVCSCAIHILFIIFLVLFNKNSNDQLSNKVIKLNKISLLLLPFYYYQSAFIRLFRNLLILNYICFANNIEKIKYKRYFGIFLAFIIFLLLVFVFYYIVSGLGFYNLVARLFENNSFFDFFNLFK